MAIWLQTSIWENRLKTIYLLILMPTIVLLAIFLTFCYIYWWITNEMIKYTITMYEIFIPLMIFWFLLSFFLNKSIVFAYTWSESLDRKRCPEIYNIVENLCISRGLQTPKIWIINDDSLNAFATWWWLKNSHIVFSRWLLSKLKKDEIEAVAAHELTHIINWDVKIMYLSTIFIWIIFLIWELLLRTMPMNKDSKWNPLFLLWAVFYLLWLIILPLVNLAISRKREFLADAWSVELTHNKDSMISALLKIKNDSNIEDLKEKSMAPMFIFDPSIKYYVDESWNKQIKKSFFGSFFSTHPTVEQRIEALQNY